MALGTTGVGDVRAEGEDVVIEVLSVSVGEGRAEGLVGNALVNVVKGLLAAGVVRVLCGWLLVLGAAVREMVGLCKVLGGAV